MGRTRVISALLSAALPLGAVACSGDNETGEAARDTLSQRQRDSLIGELPIPGAGAVRRAIEAGDSASARHELLDTLGG